MNEKLTIHLKGSPPKEVPYQGLNGMDALKVLGIDNADRLVAIRVNGEVRDLSETISSPAELEPVYMDSPEGIQILRHSASHVMAEAVKELFPSVKVTIGPAIQDGFYYDFDYERPFEADDLPKIESKMAELIDRDLPFARREIPRSEAIEWFKSQGSPTRLSSLRSSRMKQ